MKKVTIVALCLLVSASGVFALDKAAGGGILYNASFSNGSIDIGYGNSKSDWTMSRNGFGVFGFLGLGAFSELNVGFLYKNVNSIKETTGGYTGSYSGKDVGLDSVPALQLGLYGKYPIPMSDKVVLFPTAGVDFEISLGDGGGPDGAIFDWWNDLWIRAGMGLDYFLSDTMFIRGHAIYGLAIPVGGESILGLKMGHGALIKVGIGWMM